MQIAMTVAIHRDVRRHGAGLKRVGEEGSAGERPLRGPLARGPIAV